MKKLFTLLMFCPLVACAQKFEIRVGGGYNVAKSLRVNTEFSRSYNVTTLSGIIVSSGKQQFTAVPDNGATAKLQGIFHWRKRWQAGIEISAVPCSYQQYIPINVGNYTFSSPQLNGSYTSSPLVKMPTITQSFGRPLVNALLFFNYRQPIGKCIFLYGGLAGGYAHGFSQQEEPRTEYYYDSNGVRWAYNGANLYAASNGITLGGQLGGEYRLGKHFGIQAEAAARYTSMQFPVTDGSGNYHLYNFPFTAGVGYTF